MGGVAGRRCAAGAGAKVVALVVAVSAFGGVSGCSKDGLLSYEADSNTVKSAQQNGPAVVATPSLPQDDWEPDVTDYAAAQQTLTVLITQDPSCTDSTTLGKRLWRLWDAWYGDENRILSVDYGDMVSKPMEQIATSCGKPYAKDTYEAIGMDSPDLLTTIEQAP